MANKERVRLLVEALRSNEYIQGMGLLHQVETNRFCCLGVACDIAIKNGLELDVIHEDIKTYYDNESEQLPTSVVNWYGFSDDNPDILVPDGADKAKKLPAIEANDDRSWSFTKIANGFERMYLADETDS